MAHPIEERNLAYKSNIMPWSSPCKCPAHITYGRAIGFETIKLMKAGIAVTAFNEIL